jgi:hypothetical protein
MALALLTIDCDMKGIGNFKADVNQRHKVCGCCFMFAIFYHDVNRALIWYNQKKMYRW